MSDQSTQAADAGARKPPPPPRPPAEIEAEIERTRENLATRVDELQERVSPGALAATAKDKVLGLFRKPDGSLDPVRTGAAVGVTLLVVVYLVRRRRL